jgi:hypothetical protein
MNKIISITFIISWTLATAISYGQIKKENLDTLVNRLGETFLNGIRKKTSPLLYLGLY